MAKALYICARNTLSVTTRNRILAICDALAPDNIVPEPPQIHYDHRSAFAVINPNDLVQQQANSLLLGMVFGDSTQWAQPNTPLPDGCYALFRQDPDFFEIVSDPSGSRTIWYYIDDEQFVASTSQQAIIMYLGSFEFNHQVIPWILSTTGLGPDQSWDRRINLVRADSSIVLDKRSWTTRQRSNPIEFRPRQQSDQAHREDVLQALRTAFDTIDLDLSKWMVSLSGGYDSRSLLAIFDSMGLDMDGLGAVTWGTRAALDREDSDAVVARQIADHYGIDHHYFILDESTKPAEEIIDRFFRCGEGRVDHLAGYLDGFDLWRTLYEQDITGLLRGDEGFGLKVTAVSSPLTVRRSVKLAMCKDFSNLRDYEQFGIPHQALPPHLQRQIGETLSTWRDRLFHMYKLPIIVAALSDLKSPYLDQISPLLSRTILEVMRQLPDHLRDEKILFRQVVDSMGPDLPIARRTASLRTCKAIQRADLLRIVEDELRTEHARTVLPADFVDRSLRQFVALRDFPTRKSTRGTLLHLKQRIYRTGSKLTPRPIKNLLGEAVTHYMDVAVLAWRLFVISRMTTRLQNAAQLGATRKSSTTEGTQRRQITTPISPSSKL